MNLLLVMIDLNGNLQNLQIGQKLTTHFRKKKKSCFIYHVSFAHTLNTALTLLCIGLQRSFFTGTQKAMYTIVHLPFLHIVVGVGSNLWSVNKKTC